MANDRDAKQHAVLNRARPSDGKARRLLRIFGGKFALSSKQVSRLLRVGQRQAERYIERLELEGHIYPRYRLDGYVYFSLNTRRRN